MNTFTYPPLDVTGQIRFLKVSPQLDLGRISCTLRSASLEEPYNCLSYCWGSPDEEEHEILINGATFKVRPNLLSFLERARGLCPDEETWIDAISIDQQDVTEKNHQVQQMARIYRGAKTVFMWLGNEPVLNPILTVFRDLDRIIKQFRLSDNCRVDTEFSSSSSRKMRQAKQLAQKHIAQLSSQTLDAINNGLVALRSHPYGKRAWIRQEVILAQEPMLVTASQWAPFHRAEVLFWCLNDALLQNRNPDHFKRLLQNIQNRQTLQNHNFITIAKLRAAFRCKPSRYSSSEAGITLLDCCGQHPNSRLECALIHDRIYSAAGIIVGAGELAIDYLESREDLFWRAIRLFEGQPTPRELEPSRMLAVLQNILELPLAYIAMVPGLFWYRFCRVECTDAALDNFEGKAREELQYGANYEDGNGLIGSTLKRTQPPRYALASTDCSGRGKYTRLIFEVNTAGLYEYRLADDLAPSAVLQGTIHDSTNDVHLQSHGVQWSRRYSDWTDRSKFAAFLSHKLVADLMSSQR